MKNLFSSPPKLSDLQNFSNKLLVMQKQLRDLRDDNIRMSKDLRTCVKGLGLLVSTPEPDLESESDHTEDLE